VELIRCFLISSILKDLGFIGVAGILDADKASALPQLLTSFPDYHFISQPAEDIRCKTRAGGVQKTSLLTEDNKGVRPEYIDDISEKIDAINTYFASKPELTL
jgi:hypothetical protein